MKTRTQKIIKEFNNRFVNACENNLMVGTGELVKNHLIHIYPRGRRVDIVFFRKLNLT